ncbi:MAG: hypothetical protein ACK5K7_00755 [Bacilli bacterium]
MKKLLITLLALPMLFVACDDSITMEEATDSIEENLRNEENYNYQSSNYNKDELDNGNTDIDTDAFVSGKVYLMLPLDGNIDNLNSITILELSDNKYTKKYEEFFEDEKGSEFICSTGNIIVASYGDVANNIVENLCQ